MKRKYLLPLCSALLAGGLLAMLALPAPAHQGTVVKYEQLPGYLINPNDMMISGEDIPSDTDWNRPTFQIPPVPNAPNWVIADDFKDPFDTPVLTVRWWGSYVGPTGQINPDGTLQTLIGPGSEDGYVISFFTDEPARIDPSGNMIPSRPDDLLATYVAPFDAVRVTPTSHVGWDQHEIWEYEVNFQDTHLEHFLTPSIADENGLNQQPDTVYWISIMAEVGHTIVMTAAGEWVEQDTGKFALPGTSPDNPDGHFWGWHTSPEHFNDDASMGHLLMGPAGTNEWIYPKDQWRPIDPQHGLNDMAFQLLTIPEPASVVLVLCGVCAFAAVSRKLTR